MTTTASFDPATCAWANPFSLTAPKLGPIGGQTIGGGCILDKTQARGLAGGAFLVAGGLVMLAGVIILIAAAAASKRGQSVQGAVAGSADAIGAAPGPGRVAARGVRAVAL